jgi:hypothetical protein
MFRGASRLQLVILAIAAALLGVPAAAQATPTFLSAINISDPGQDGFEPEVAVAPDGTVIAVWTRSDGSNFRIQSSNRTPNGAWSAAQTISDVGEASSGPSLAVDPAGNAIAVWTQSDGTNLRIHSAYKPAGSSFGADVTVSGAGQDASAPDVSMDNSGNALVVWQRYDATPPAGKLRVQAAIRTPGAGGTFGTPTTLSVAGQDAFEPRTEAGPNVDANGVVVWTRSDGTNLRVQSSRRKDVTGFPRPKGATPTRISLVPAFNQCTSPNRTHGPSLAFPSCASPVQTSSVLTIGSPDNNGFAANFVGSIRFIVVPGNTTTDADEADVKLVVAMSDIRNRPSGTDYVGRVLAEAELQITDNSNAAEAPEPGTVQKFRFQWPVDCVSTTSTTIGSNCNLTTTADSVLPGAVTESRRTIWEIGQGDVKDAGPNGTGYASCPPTCGDGDESVFLRQGVYVP